MWSHKKGPFVLRQGNFTSFLSMVCEKAQCHLKNAALTCAILWDDASSVNTSASLNVSCSPCATIVLCWMRDICISSGIVVEKCVSQSDSDIILNTCDQWLSSGESTGAVLSLRDRSLIEAEESLWRERETHKCTSDNYDVRVLQFTKEYGSNWNGLVACKYHCSVSRSTDAEGEGETNQ